MQQLLRVHAHQIFHTGHFNADCHPGNIWLMRDGSLGLIDFGQCKTMTRAQIVEFSKLVMTVPTLSQTHTATGCGLVLRLILCVLDRSLHCQTAIAEK